MSRVNIRQAFLQFDVEKKEALFRVQIEKFMDQFLPILHQQKRYNCIQIY